MLYEEPDACVVSALMWHWLDSLREPILHPQDMPNMLGHEDVIDALHVLDKVRPLRRVVLIEVLLVIIIGDRLIKNLSIFSPMFL